jgi:undecaprenyl-diphosphatase
MLDLLHKIDREIFLYFNGLHNEISGSFWAWITYAPTWIPLYILFVGLFIYHFKKDSIWVIIAVGLVAACTDQVTSSIMKPYFARLRPCHDPVLGLLANVITGCGGKYGFASGHSANAFGFASFTWLALHRRWPWTGLLFVWAAMVAFSRIMVGVHYPSDITVGALVGMAIAGLIFILLNKIYFHFRIEPLIKN